MRYRGRHRTIADKLLSTNRPDPLSFLISRGFFSVTNDRKTLLDLAFFELDVLTSNWIVFLNDHLFGHRA